MFFCIDSCGHIETYDTADEAEKAAEAALEFERDNACDGWSEDVNNIMWGKVHGFVKQTYCRPKTDEDFFVSSDCLDVADYHIEKIT